PAPPRDSSRLRPWLASLSSSRLVVPEQLVQLQLEADRQAFGDDPVRQPAAVDLAEAGREQHITPLVQPMLEDQVAGPFEVRAVAKHEFELVARRQQVEVLQ